MLVLTRKCGESLTIPDLGIKITLVAVEGGRVRLGFDGPREVAIVREKHPKGSDRGRVAAKSPAKPMPAADLVASK